MTISIIGSGKVGASVALNCGLRELDPKINLLDIVEGLPQGEAMDINHQLSEKGLDSYIVGSNDYSELRNSDIVVLVAGVGRKPGMTRMDLLKTNASIVRDVSLKISENVNDCILIVVTNPLDPMTYLALKTTKFSPKKVMGMGGMLDLSRFTSFIHDFTKVSRNSISAMVIGEHGENMLPLIRFSSIAGIPLHEFIDKDQSDQIYEKTKQVAAEVIKFKGATVYAPGNAVSTMIESIVKDKKAVIPISAFLEGQYGIRDVCLGAPAIVGKNGIEKIIELPLNEFEKDQIIKGANSVKEAISNLFNINFNSSNATMDLKDILLDYYNGKKSLDEAIKTLSLFSIEYIENNVAQIDVNRDIRKAVPEIVFAANKKTMEIVSISDRILERKGYVVISKIRSIAIKKLINHYKKRGFFVDKGHNSSSMLIYDKMESLPANRGGKIGIICGGTSDIGIAEEARIASLSMGCSSVLGYDVGISGIQRLLLSLKEMISNNVDVLVVVAGMEGALPSVVTSLVSIPVIGVPASVGYGFGSNGIGSLSSMLQSCSFGLAVVNIDNGMGAGIFASLIANKGRF